MTRAAWCGAFVLAWAGACGADGIWIGRDELKALPVEGPAWENLKAEADRPAGAPNLADQDDPVNVRVMAKALVFARTGEERYRAEVVEACRAAMGTEAGARSLAVGRELAAYVIAADLVGLPEAVDGPFRVWLRELLTKDLSGKTLVSTHEVRPNNWGTMAGASRIAVAAYLGDREELDRAARVFRGWLGERDAYAGFKFGDLAWQADPSLPVAINARGAARDGHSLDGVLPDDQRRAEGGFVWPPPKENYVYEALQGALVQAVLLQRAGYDPWSWGDRALLRAFRWLHDEASFPPDGDDVWELPLVDRAYGTTLWDGRPTRPGKVAGWTCWTHGAAVVRSSSIPPADVPAVPSK